MASIVSRTLRRAALDSHASFPPTFLLPWTANLTTVSHATETSDVPPPSTARPLADQQKTLEQSIAEKTRTQRKSAQPGSSASTAPLPAPGQTSTLELSPQVRELLPLLRAQGPHYVTAHIYGRPYLLTQGDTLRLPFYMKGVEPGDVLRLDRATHLGSRDYTLKAAAPAPKLKSSTMETITVVDPTSGSLSSESRVMPHGEQASGQNTLAAPHFVPNIAKGKISYIDDRLFVCRAVVMGVESEPLRIKEKTKRRQRKVKQVKSKHRFTVLKVKEVRVRSQEEIDAGDVD